MSKINYEFLIELFSFYNFEINQFVGYKVISKGHINTTYVLYFDYGNKVKRFLLQEININVFKEPNILMKNISEITSYLEAKLKVTEKNYKNKVLRILLTKDNNTYVKLSDDTYWRIYHYIENSISIDKTDDKNIYYQAGLCIGSFINDLSTFNLNNLNYVIKDFHNTIKRYDYFLKVLNKSLKEKKEKCEKEINFFISNNNIPFLIQPLIDNGKMPLRVTHNDTKLNNFLFEYKSNEYLCLIDLDTVMQGCICFDFGDFIRSACSSALEDEKDLNKVIFQKEKTIKFAEGFINKTKNSITLIELENLINGAIVMTYECGMRFLTDYLENNVYFKVEYDDHNLIRAKTQIHLCNQIIKQKQELEKTILDIYNAQE